MGRVNFFILLCAFSLCLNAASIIDVYGIDFRQAEDLIKNYGTQVGDIESRFIDAMIKISNGGKDDYFMKVVFPKKNQLIDNIKKQYDFAYVQFDTIVYPNDKDIHTTIEVVGQNDKDRLRFIPKKDKAVPTTKSKHDLIEKMIEFHNSSMNLILNNQLNTKGTKCPVYHCLPGFNHPKLKKEFSVLTDSAPKEKDLLVKTINSDPLPQRRTAAIYLIGYFNDPQEILSLLTRHVMDSDEGVRNSAMRVISETMNKAKIHDINVMPFLNLLDSPFDTDRNKALLVLLNAASSTLSKQLIIQKGNKKLVSLLRLKQPNNHDVTYALLKKISDKDFGSNNIDAWEKWLDTMNKNRA
ncbi:HEAT repeat domain-containing protein [Legionella fairfieldensis]|uniref:HEAT repeat domain-containing protein n=1 Tax=Legionella fairfieldensis TaxID=45064 RepID=UPI00048FB0B1|nr:HEAT repeat domain-containing protein [Legionella fairfieldensis]